MKRGDMIKGIYNELKDAGYPEPSVSLIEDVLFFAEELGMLPPSTPKETLVHEVEKVDILAKEITVGFKYELNSVNEWNEE